jgi:5-methylcytosine-specific restriction endonuclease McrA
VSTAWKGGSTRRWRKIRAAVLAANEIENGGRCTLTIPGVCTGRADTVHHTHGKAVTGDDPQYLQATCRACNLHVGEPGKNDPQPRPMTRW